MIDYSSFLILDCKTTVWETSSDQPTGQIHEIINVDIALVDTGKQQIVDQERIIVKPHRSKISPFCEKVYGFSQEDVDSRGVSFEEAYRRIRIHYMSPDRLWGTWEPYDKYILEKQCKSSKLDFLFNHSNLNIQHLFALFTSVTREDGNPPQLHDALRFTNIGVHKNDAVNAANLFLCMTKGLRPNSKLKISSLDILKHFN